MQSSQVPRVATQGTASSMEPVEHPVVPCYHAVLCMDSAGWQAICNEYIDNQVQYWIHH